jgi:hypothetical protein
MFSRSFIELLIFYTNINRYAANRLSNYSLMYKNTVEDNLYTVDNYLVVINIYKDFIDYYDSWFSSYFH